MSSVEKSSKQINKIVHNEHSEMVKFVSSGVLIQNNDKSIPDIRNKGISNSIFSEETQTQTRTRTQRRANEQRNNEIDHAGPVPSPQIDNPQIDWVPPFSDDSDEDEDMSPNNQYDLIDGVLSSWLPRDNDSNTNRNTRVALRPSVEWVYPSRDQNNENSVNERSQNIRTDIESGQDQFVPHSGIDYIVDPAHISVILTVEGELLPTKYCLLKVFGFTLCDDIFPCLLNPKFYPILFGSLLLITAVAILAGKIVIESPRNIAYNSYDDHTAINPPSPVPSIPFLLPSNTVSHLPSYISSQISTYTMTEEITQIILSISGDIALEQKSAQNKALLWITKSDTLNSTYKSPTLVQRYVLMVLFYSFTGDQWFENDGYGSDEHECDWYGMKCYGKVLSGIILEHNNLKGQLPKEISAIPGLRELNLASNCIDGHVPKEIAKLQRMTELRLDANLLSGTIPEEIQLCKNLNVINLEYNQ